MATLYDYTAINMETAKVEHFRTNADFKIGEYIKHGGRTVSHPQPLEYAIVHKEIWIQF